MKAVAINYSGNVGKSTICNTLLSPRMNNAKIFRIESINDSGMSSATEERKLRGSQFAKLQDEILRLDDAIVDVGASNIEEFMVLMNQYDESHVDFDYFIVPVLASNKAVKEAQDTIKTILALKALGVEKERILVLFNRLDPKADFDDECGIILNFHRKNNSFILNRDAVIENNELWVRLAQINKSFEEILTDPTDYRIALKTEVNEDKRTRLVQLIAAQRAARGIKKNMDSVFNSMFPARD